MGVEKDLIDNWLDLADPKYSFQIIDRVAAGISSASKVPPAYGWKIKC